jgi:hypothetical protein
MIPEFLHDHGPEAAKWFTSQGISVYKDVRWDPKKGTTSSTNAKASAAMVEEDLWDLGDKWKTLAEKEKEPEKARPNKQRWIQKNHRPIRRKTRNKTTRIKNSLKEWQEINQLHRSETHSDAIWTAMMN